MERVLGLEEALATVVEHAASLRDSRRSNRPAESLPLLEALGRTLAQPVRAPRDQPPFDRSTRDGFAVRADDVRGGAALGLLGSVRAGECWQGSPVAPGEAVEIMTGAPLPDGADAVLMVEHTASHEQRVIPAEGRSLQPGENVVPRGAEARSGDAVLGEGQRFDAAAVALAASCGAAEVEVVPRPRVAVLSTGDELVELISGDSPQPWQIVNSNSYALAALLAAQGALPERLPIVPDRREALDASIRRAQGADLLLLSGGVSMGHFDLVEAALAGAGAEFFFTGARIQPGKPVVFGRLPRTAASPAQGSGTSTWIPFFGLPGNPVSTEVCFHLFVATMVRALAGRTDLEPRFVEARAEAAFEGRRGLVRLLPCALTSTWQHVGVRPVRWQGSGDLAANALADGFCVVEEQGVAAGATARVLLR